MIKVGSHVKVGKLKPDGTPHPQADKTGVVTELLGVYTSWGTPRAMIVIDKGFADAGNYMIVSLSCLKELVI